MAGEISKLICRVCGKIQDDPPWGEDGKCPNYDICDCCGVEFGYGDCTLTAIRASRERWLVNGGDGGNGGNSIQGKGGDGGNGP